MSFKNFYSDYKWIKVKRYNGYDRKLPPDENYNKLSQHHIEETSFLIDEVRKLAALLDARDNEEAIPFNIWDDYDEDEGGETNGYIENDMTEEEKKPILEMIFHFIVNQIYMPEVKVELDDRIYFTNLSHERLERLVKELEKSGLKYEGRKINFYSES